mmetsp:Transcript_30659/g.40729  ORF Transcript_30659/g.40729 Transcript_30659/m.40729 type:complete len:96 (+) Transcript_30659:19-306(+)
MSISEHGKIHEESGKHAVQHEQFTFGRPGPAQSAVNTLSKPSRRLQISTGIVPLKKLLCIKRVSILFSTPSSEGIAPSNLFECNDRPISSEERMA